MQRILLDILGGKGRGERRYSRSVVYHASGGGLAVRQIRETGMIDGDLETKEALRGVV